MKFHARGYDLQAGEYLIVLEGDGRETRLAAMNREGRMTGLA
ncbi:MAG: hypothetical protein WBM81_15520 [Sedimenticolaceae bacterium]